MTAHIPQAFSPLLSYSTGFHYFFLCHCNVIFYEVSDPEERNKSLLATVLFLAILETFGRIGRQVDEHQPK